ncbi:hypothetical protein N7461_005449 [Penicillium sp. DV-2018c]|nr:hypothetical protein N7461_005449 [Penicillium sp. DV-2018c]
MRAFDIHMANIECSPGMLAGVSREDVPSGTFELFEYNSYRHWRCGHYGADQRPEHAAGMREGSVASNAGSIEGDTTKVIGIFETERIRCVTMRCEAPDNHTADGT